LLVLLAVPVATLAGIATAPTAAPAVAATPTCLIVNGGGGGRFTKSLVCATLSRRGPDRVGSGRYGPPDDVTPHWLTVAVEFRTEADVAWIILASATERGTGPLRAATEPVTLPGPGVVRACARAGTGNPNTPPIAQLCTPARSGADPIRPSAPTDIPES
jgi:hypothetical protein